MRIFFLLACLITLVACESKYEDDTGVRMRDAEPDCHQMYGNSEHCSGR